MKNVILLFSLLFCSFTFSQIKKDTVFIYFDSIHQSMRKGCAKIRVYDKNRNIIKKLVITYYIEEKVRPNPQMHDTGYSFSYIERTAHEIKTFGGPENPVTLIKNLDFLKRIKLLDHQFFETTDYLKVCKAFEAEDSWEQDVIIFVIDKDEINEGTITLREVIFSRPVKE